MSHTMIGFIIGLFVGAPIGLFAAALAAANGRASRHEEAFSSGYRYRLEQERRENALRAGRRAVRS